MRYMLLWVCLTMGLIFTACQEKDVFADSVNNLQAAVFKAVQVAPNGVNTRATDGGFEQGDQIGIYVVRRNSNNDQGTLKAAGNYADNKRYVIDQNGRLQPFSAEDQIFLSHSEVYDFYAYYPYDAAMTDPTNYEFRVSADQINKTDYTASDFMLARNLGSKGQDIALVFERKMALVEMYFQKVDGKSVSAAVITMVKYNAFLNFSTNESQTGTYIPSQVRMNLYRETSDSYVFRALLPVQELKGNYIFHFTVDDEVLHYNATTITPLTAGKRSIYTINMQYHIQAFPQYLVTGSVTGIEKEIFNHGENIHVRAVANPGYYFVGWYESLMVGWQDNLPRISDQPDLYVTATKSVCYIARFDPILQPIIVKAVTLGDDDNGGTVYGSGNFVQGQLHSVRAVAKEGFDFIGWYVDNVRASNSLTYEFTVPDHPVTLEARFQRKLITITLDCYPSKEVLAPYYDKPSKVTAKYGDEIKLYGLILTDSPYTFDGFYENGIYLNRNYPYIFKATEDRRIELRYGWRIFGLGAGDAFGILSQPGYFTRSTNDKDIHPTFMNKGQKVRITGKAECQVYINECSTPVRITDKKLAIKIGDRVVWENSDFEDFIFTAPENATYTFHYSMTVEGRLQEGERVGLTTSLTRMAWFIE